MDQRVVEVPSEPFVRRVTPHVTVQLRWRNKKYDDATVQFNAILASKNLRQRSSD